MLNDMNESAGLKIARPRAEFATLQFLVTHMAELGLESEAQCEVMTYREMLSWVTTHGSKEHIHELFALNLPRIEDADSDENDLRRQRIKLSRQADNLEPSIVLDHGVPGARGFADYDVNVHPNAEKAWEAVFDWQAYKTTPLLVLAGPPGVGKTSLADAAGGQLLGTNQTVVFRREQDLLTDLRDRFTTKTSDAALKEYGLVPWLILDELGGSTPSDFNRSSMDQLIDARWQGARAGKRTLITTNLSGDNLPQRIASRIQDREVSTIVDFKGVPDYRLQGGRREWREDNYPSD